MINEWERVKNHLRIARKAGKPATLSLTEWKHTLADFNGMCAYCLNRPYELLEHFIPVNEAGTHVNNCIPACGDCNKKKRNYTDEKLITAFDHFTVERIKAYLASRTQSPDEPRVKRAKPQIRVKRVYYVCTKTEYERMKAMGREVRMLSDLKKAQ